MPKSGSFIRTTLALGLAGLVAAIAVSAAAAAPARKTATTISGAGSTFVAPLIAQWIPAVGSAYGYNLQYSAIGSGGGIASITARDVDFGASDAPLSPDQFSACNGCIQIPWALAATSVFYNIPGAKNLLKLDGSTLAKIYLGQITNWNDPAIAKMNPGANLPNLAITVAHRSDGSGTTYNFADYLSSVSSAWKKQVGLGTSLNWPTGVGGKGSSGVAAIVKQTPGAIGYADVAYALANHLSYFKMKNRSGRLHGPGAAQYPPGGEPPDDARQGRIAVDRQPAEGEEVQECVPDLDLHVRHRSEDDLEGQGPEDLHQLGGHARPEPSARSSSSSRCRWRSSSSTRSRSSRSTRKDRMSSADLTHRRRPPPLHGAAGAFRRHLPPGRRGRRHRSSRSRSSA